MALNLDKYKSEWKKFSDAFRDPPAASHPGGELPNRFVEACRESPYIAGHLLLVLVIIVLLVMVL